MPFLNRFFILLVLGLPACASVQTPSQPIAPSTIAQTHLAPGQLTYTIKKGETLWHIARMYQVDLESLARINKINDTRQISTGQVIVLPLDVHSQAPSNNFVDASPSEFIWPAKGIILSYFQQKNSGVANKGIDIAMQNNQDVIATRGGKVVFVGNLAGYGNTIIIDHADGFSSVYCGSNAIDVKINDGVSQGTIIAKAGTLPRAARDTLHFEIRKRHKPINPLFFLD
jgi:murein DD-endopeptidase MepM/ murein hydrolase activator NlpD